MDTVLGIILGFAIVLAVMVVDWRKTRRLVGHWIAGNLPRTAHCPHCGHVLTALCVGCREAAVERRRA